MSRILLGYPLDQLMDPGKCRLLPSALVEKDNPEWGGLCFDDGHCTSITGNIIIRGRPGTGKSTLALQIAVACAQADALAVYISLEPSVDKVIRKANDFGWTQWIRPVEHLHPIEEPASREKKGKLLAQIMTQPSNCPQRIEQSDAGTTGLGCVLLPMFSPRSISPEMLGTDRLFWVRYRQLEHLLDAGEWLGNQQDGVPVQCHANHQGTSEQVFPKLRVVCVDSLTVFGDGPLTREQLFRLFDLFTRHGVTGVLIVEDDVARSSDIGTPMRDDTIDHLADVVITLEAGEDKGHVVNYLEITKSRFRKQVLGKHPYKIRSVPNGGKLEERDSQAFTIYPSVHYLVSSLSGSENTAAAGTGDFDVGCAALRQILPQNLSRQSVVTMQGPRGTFKTTLALNFLVAGLKEGENGLLIRLNDGRLAKLPSRVSKDMEEIGALAPAERSGSRPGKVLKTTWSSSGLEGNIIELDFNTGYLLPEELMDEVYTTFVETEKESKRIGRVVLDDVATIGLSYPLLYSSRTAADMFLSAFVHFMRTRKVDLVMTATTGGLASANECVSRACAASDAVLSCDFCDVFGARHVIINGEGLIAGMDKTRADGEEQVPGILNIHDKPNSEIGTFSIDLSHLKGLVGFDSGRIRRPGLSLHLFEGVGTIHKRYNQDVERMLRFAFACTGQKSPGSEQAVDMMTFNSRASSSMFDSLELLPYKSGSVQRTVPLDKTVVCCLDEFCITKEHQRNDLLVDLGELTDEVRNKYLVELPDEERYHVIPYYANVLLMAYRNDILEDGFTPGKWTEVKDLVSGISCGLMNEFEYDLTATETGACLMLDAAYAVMAEKPERTDHFTLTEDGAVGKLDLSSDRYQNELMALRDLMLMSPERPMDRALMDDPDELRKARTITPDSAVYVCWYSQLRELIYTNPGLADKLSVCALPGRGFRGDWYLAVNRGSLSVSLGKDVIRILTRESEEYKRFARGVGLPSLNAFGNGKFAAWPNAKNTLDDVLKIHGEAWSRSHVDNYMNLRRTLYTAAQSLSRSKDDAIAMGIIEGIPDQLKAISAMSS